MRTKYLKIATISAFVGLMFGFVMTARMAHGAEVYSSAATSAATTINIASAFDSGLPDSQQSENQQKPAEQQEKTTEQQQKPAEQEKPAEQQKPAEQVYKNIQIFQGLPAERLMGAMNFFTRSLGVKCNHCHIPREFYKDEKPTKLTARKMYTMVRLINKELDTNKVSCYMCHRGHAQPEPPPDTFTPSAEEREKAEQDKRPAEQVYKNVQVLKGVPAGRWMIIMNMFAKSLGVDCAYCHVKGEWDKDDKPAKLTARKMLKMTDVVAREVFAGSSPVNCYTCHRGQPQTVSFPPVPQNAQ